MLQDRETVEALLQRAYTEVTKHHLKSAGEILERALSIDFDNHDVVTALKYVNFWQDRQETVESMNDVFEQGEYLLEQWRVFKDFVDRIGDSVEPALNAVRQHAFREALRFYREVYQERSNRDADLLVRIGRCYKGAGDYDRAVKFLQSAAVERPDNPEIMAELADSFALINEPSKAKAFFREAFFLDARKVNAERLESEMIQRLVQAVEKAGYTGMERNEWIPVFGVLKGVFNVKRELRSIEFGRLKQSIYLLEKELREGSPEADLIKPKLVFRYFWLLDHYVIVGESQDKMDEVLLKIRSVDANVYHEYTR